MPAQPSPDWGTGACYLPARKPACWPLQQWALPRCTPCPAAQRTKENPARAPCPSYQPHTSRPAPADATAPSTPLLPPSPALQVFAEYVKAAFVSDVETGTFDFVSIDGRARVACFPRALQLLRPHGGVLVLDNAERPYYRRALVTLGVAGWPGRCSRLPGREWVPARPCCCAALATSQRHIRTQFVATACPHACSCCCRNGIESVPRHWLRFNAVNEEDTTIVWVSCLPGQCGRGSI